jgi:hypothetical protein
MLRRLRVIASMSGVANERKGEAPAAFVLGDLSCPPPLADQQRDCQVMFRGCWGSVPHLLKSKQASGTDR